MSTRISDAIFWVAVVACAIAQLFILRAVFRVTPSAGSSSESIAEASGVPAPHRLTEIVWVLLPVLLLALAFFGAWRAMHPASFLPDYLRPDATVIHS
jgi:hypothetical protein